VRRWGLAALAALVAVGGVSAAEDASVELLPDLDQVTPYKLSVQQVGGRRLLAFASAVGNIGDGPLIVDGRRASRAVPTMKVMQTVLRADGSRATAPVRGVIRYVKAESHAHWHLLRVERYELRLPEGELVRPDRKTGFCLGDRYRIEPPPHGAAKTSVFREECGRGRPRLLRVREGVSVGYGDDYDPLLEGQSIDVTDLPPGQYVLVHRANPDGNLRERDYENNAASVLVALTADAVSVLARCPQTPTCP
jgi:Lysyl oxidase